MHVYLFFFLGPFAVVQNLRQNSQRRVGLERGVRAAVLDQQAANGQVIDSSGRWSSAKSSRMLSERSRAYSRPFLNVFFLFIGMRWMVKKLST